MTTQSGSADSSNGGMSLREKCAWGSLISTVTVYAVYFVYVGGLLEGGQFKTWNVFSATIDAVVVQGLSLSVGLALFAWRNRQERKDERDETLERWACRNAYFVLAAGCFLLVLGMPVYAASRWGARQEFWFAPLLLSQALLLCFVVAEVVRFGTLAVGYRRGN